MFCNFGRKSVALQGKRTRHKVGGGRLKRQFGSCLRLEALEPRWLLDAGPLYISEFMASNDNSALVDKFGKHSDWIEIYNPTNTVQSLDGWYLTDDADDLTKWQFPDTNPSPTTDVPLAAGGYLVVFASNNDLAVPGQEFHTNFKIGDGGGYLALVQPDGTTIASHYNYPEQLTDVSYGMSMSSTTLVASGASGATAKALVPSSSNPSDWMQYTYDDSSWTISGKTGIGFDNTTVTTLPAEAESNNTKATANNATNNFSAYSGNLYHLGITGSIPTVDGDNDDWYKIGDLQVGDVITLTQSGSPSSRGTMVDPKVELWRDGSGSAVTTNNDGGPGLDSLIARYSITVNDEYYIRCRRNDTNSGTYQLGVWLVKSGPTLPTTGGTFTQEAEPNDNESDHNNASSSWRAVQYLSHTTGTISSTSDIDYYQYQFAAGDLVTVNIDSTSTLDAKVSLLNNDGTVIALEDGSSSFTSPYDKDSPLYAYIIPTSGNYYVKVESNSGTGAYSADIYLSSDKPPPGTYSSSIQTNISAQMSGVNSSVYIRIPFSATDPSDIDSLMLRIKYDDGFVAYLNGVEVARRNAPGTVGTPPAWNAAATAEHYHNDGAVFEEINISEFVGLLGAGNVLAIHGLNLSASDADFLVVPELIGVALDVGNPQFFNPTSPGAANTTESSVLGQVSDTHFSVERGFYDTSFDVSITCNTQGSVIHYTVNGRDPGAADNTKSVSGITRSGTTATATCVGHGYAVNDWVRISGANESEYNGIFIITSVTADTFDYTITGTPATPATGTITAQDNYYTYTGPINISTTTTLRAAAFKTGYISSNVDTETYIFLDDVIEQPHYPAGYPTQWIDQNNVPAPSNHTGETGVDYEMDQEVVDDPAYSSEIIDALLSLPSISLVMNPDDWFGNGSTGTNGIKGIYSNANPSNPDPQTNGGPDLWKRETSVELINPDGSEGFQINAGVKIHGGGSSYPEKAPKHSFTLSFNDNYEGRLNYQFFGADAADSYRTLILRSGYNNTWFHANSAQRDRGILIQDEWNAQTQLAMGDLSRHGTFVHLYLNGLYWGVYNLVEVPNANFAETYLGGDASDYDVIKVNEDSGLFAHDGDMTAYNAMFTAANAGLSTPEAYANFKKYLDIPNFIDYMISKYYAVDNDWDGHNWTAIRRSRLNGMANDTLGGFIFISWDAERTLEGVNENKIGVEVMSNGPARLFNKLKQNAEFCQLWANRLHELLFNDGALTPTKAAARFTALATQVDASMIAESARWGDYRRDVNSQGYMWSLPVYLYTRDVHWVAERDRLINTYFPSRTSIFLNQCINYSTSLYPSLDAPEYSLPSGGYLTGTLSITNPDGVGAVYYTLDGSDPRVSDTVQMVFSTGTPEKVKSVTLSGTTATVKLPNHGLVNGQTVAISGAHEGQYNTASAVISNVTQDTFDYTVTGSPASPASGAIYVTPYGITRNGTTAIVTLPGHGFANGNLVLVSGASPTNYNGIFTIFNVTANTFSYTVSGSPTSPATGTIYVRRVDKAVSSISYSGTLATATVPSHGFVNGDLVRITGATPTQYNGDFIITYVNANTFTYTMASSPGANASGTIAATKVVTSSAMLYTGPITLTQSARVKARVLNGTTWSALDNQQFYINAPASAATLVLTEVNYHPLAPAAGGNYSTDDFQYIELKNTSAQTIDLTDVQLRLGFQVAFDFAGSAVTTLAPGGYVLIAEDQEGLISRYGSGIAAQIAGEFSGELSHDGERMCLRDYLDQTLVDFIYNDSGPWPGRADGLGSSLEVISTAGDYNDPDNWRSSSEYLGSPGSAGAGPLASAVVNEVLSHTDYPLYDSIELYNTTNAAINLGGWYISDSSDDYKKYRIPDGTSIGPYGYLVFTEEQFGISSFSGDTQPGNGAAQIQDSGATLFLDGSTWRKIAFSYTVTSNTILEFDYYSDTQGQIQGIGFDEDNVASAERLFQLYGTSTYGIQTYNTYSSGWTHYTISVGSYYTGSMSYLVFANGDSANVATSYFKNVKVHEGTPGAALNFDKYFNLSFTGDEVWLLQADGAGNLTYFIDHVEFGAAKNGESFGRWPNATGDLYPLINRTFGQTNDYGGNGPRIGPLVISEVMYHPSVSLGQDPDDYEYIEIYNPTATVVNLTHWRIRKGVDFDFADGTTIAAYGTLVVLPFDPSDTTRLNNFKTKYGVGPTVSLVGGFSGHLDNDGETVQLQRPDDPEGDPPTYPGVIEDEVRYVDVAPWPTGADGSGYSLQRLSATEWGDDPTNWIAYAPNPGSVTSPVYVTQWIFYNNSRYDGHTGYISGDPAANVYDDNAIATDKQALMPGETASFVNYTSYSRGINGIMIDVQHLATVPNIGNYTQFFEFKVGNDNAPGSWSAAPAPVAIGFRTGDGIKDTDRITIIWDANAIDNQWLQVTVKANATTGLPVADVFYFGNAVAESGDNSANAVVTVEDELASRTHKSGIPIAAITNFYDYNRDGRVNATDDIIARHNRTDGGGDDPLQLITAPSSSEDTFQALSALAEGAASQTALVAEIAATQPELLLSAEIVTTPQTSAPVQELSISRVSYISGGSVDCSDPSIVKSFSVVDHVIGDRLAWLYTELREDSGASPLEEALPPRAVERQTAAEDLGVLLPRRMDVEHIYPASLENRLHDAVFTRLFTRRSLMEDSQPDDIEMLLGDCAAEKVGKSFAQAIDTVLAEARHKKVN